MPKEFARVNMIIVKSNVYNDHDGFQFYFKETHKALNWLQSVVNH